MTLTPSLPAATLTVSGLTMRFGGLVAVESVSFTAPSDRITAIIGPNGAGKTTLFNCMTGFYKPTEGTVTLQRDGSTIALTGLPPHRIARAGLARTFQNIRLFGTMTVFENILAAADQGQGDPRQQAEIWLDRLGLSDYANRVASTLPYGLQRRLEIARALATGPSFLCLDEPAAGLNPGEAAALRKLLRSLRDEYNVGLLLIEHNMRVVMDISDHIVVLDYGRMIAEGPPDVIRTHPAVIRAYLGEPEKESA